MFRRPRVLPSDQLPNRLREWRIARGLSMEALAERMGSSKQTIDRHEKSTDVSLKALIRYASVLGVRVEELLIDSLRIPPRLVRLVKTAEQLPPKEQEYLEDISASMVRRTETAPQPSGMREDDEPFNHTN